MAVNYLSILKTKRGEFTALSYLENDQKKRLLPLFDLTKPSKSVARFEGCFDITQAYVDETAEKIAEVWGSRAALVDAMRWPADQALKSGVHLISYFYERLTTLGVKVIPVLGYDRWESDVYRDAMGSLELDAGGQVCLRLDTHALEDSADPDFLEDRVKQMLQDMALTPANCLVLIDFEDTTVSSIEQLVDQGHSVIAALAGIGFKHFATAGCSIPASIEQAVSKPDSTGKIVRREWTLWRSLRAAYPKLSWLFGDYAVRGPKAADDIIAPDTNGKIRYTTSGGYFIARGHSLRKGNKGAQMYDLAKVVKQSPHFMGPTFSWGDRELVKCSNGDFKGAPWKWIAIDSSHHITWVVAEVEEFVQQHAGSNV